MGRGDMKTKKGKRTAGSYGNTRPRKKTKSTTAAPKAAKAPKVAKAKAPAKKAAKKKED